MPSKKDKHQNIVTDMKSEITPLHNSTNTTSRSNESKLLTNSYMNSKATTTTEKRSLYNDKINSLDHLSLIRGQKTELDLLNNRFSNYVNELSKKSKEHDDLQKKVDIEKQKNLSTQDNHDLETQMNDLRHEMDESVVLTEHFILKHNRALKELALLQDKIRNEELNSFGKRRQALENEYQQTLLQIQELKQTYENVEKLSEINKNEMNQMNDLYKKHEDELHDLILNNIRLQNNIRTIEEQILFKKATYETEKAELMNEQLKQKQFYTDELGKAIEDIKHDFQILLKNNKTLLENSYAERIEQTKTQILAIEAAKQQEQPSSPRVSIDTLRNEVKQTEQVHQDLENEYRTLIEHYLSKQKDKNQIDEERLRLDNEYSRLVAEINHVTQAIESGKQYWFSVNFELETYRRLLDLETSKVTTPNPIITSKMINEYANNNIAPVSNGKEKQNGITAEEQQVLTTKKTDLQRSISKTGQFDIDQVQAGFISINNAATNCADQSLKGWTLVHTINKEPQNVYQFPDGYVLRARTRVRVYSNKVENMGKNNANNSRLFAASIPVWTSSNKGDDVKILLIDDKGVTRAQYSETWQ